MQTSLSTVSDEKNDRNVVNVTAVVPSYNHAGFVEQALRSIFNQTVLPRELIVIDDGSKDDSAGVIERTLKDSPCPAAFYSRENRGLCATLNEALDRASGDYFAYLGSDDLWLNHFLEHRIEALDSDPNAALAYGRLHAIDEHNEIIGEPFNYDYYKHLSTRDRLLYGFAPASSGIVYRKSFLLEDRWDPTIKLEDYDLYLRLCMKGEFLFDERTDAAWRLHGKNTSSGYEFMMHELIAAIERNAEGLKLTEQELQTIIASKRAAHIDMYLADHNRAEAIRLYRDSLAAFPTAFSKIKKAIKIMTPFAINDRRTARIIGGMRKRSNRYIDKNFEVAAIET